MKYITVDREHEDIKWSKIYCNLNGKETPEDIAKQLFLSFYVGKFNKEEHMNAGCPKIQNDENFILSLEIHMELITFGRFGGRLTDMTGFIIPHLYKVRRIGVFV